MKHYKHPVIYRYFFSALAFQKNRFWSVLFLLLGCFPLKAQKTLSLDSLWNGAYDASRMESIRSMKDGASYTLLKDTENEQANQLVQSYYKKPKEVLVLIDSRDYEQIERFTDYSFSKNEEKILLESDDLPIYRRSKIADYWVFDRLTKKLQRIS